MTRDDLHAVVVRLLAAHAAGGTRDDATFDRVLRAIHDHQRDAIDAVGRLAAHAAARGRTDVVAVPTDVFKHTRVAAHPANRDIRVFRTSGTSTSSRGAHHLCDLSLYETSAKLTAKHFLFPDRRAMDMLVLAPSEDDLPDSSLSFMLSRFAEWFGDRTSWAMPSGQLDASRLVATCDRAACEDRPVAILGTSFAFVHGEDGLGATRWRLPPGSRVMMTGGYKGRSRVVDPAELRIAISQRYGIAEPFIVGEYGMTELSSQLYETTLRHAAVGDVPPERLYAGMGWVRVTTVAPDTLAPLPPGTRGLVRIDDLANLDTAVAIVTGDLGVVTAKGALELHGRAAGADARGCSIAADVMLGGADGPA